VQRGNGGVRCPGPCGDLGATEPSATGRVGPRGLHQGLGPGWSTM
jgi:hypothetical protein